MAMRQNTPEQIKQAESLLARRRKAQAAAQKQAEADAVVKPKPPSDRGVNKGEQVPLSILRHRAKAIRDAERTLHREASVAAAKAVNETLSRGGKKIPRASAQKPAGPNTAAAMSAETASKEE